MVVDEEGRDVTGEFVRGAEETLRIAGLVGARSAILKEKSPSCGVSVIKTGGRTTQGRGVAAALLERKGIETAGVD